MKFLIFGDLQISDRRQDYMAYTQQTLQYLGQLVRERRPDYLINLGDLIDTFGTVRLTDLGYAYEWMNYLGREMAGGGTPHNADGNADALRAATADPRLWILKGNHDMDDREGKRASCQVMEQNARIFMELTTTEIDGFGYALVLPYTRDYAHMMNTLESIAELDVEVKVIFAHTDWIGCRMTPAMVSKEGLEPVKVQELFPNATIFAGHYHHPQTVGNLHIVGSPQHMRFDDVLGAIPRGFAFWDSETGTVERIPNPYTFYCAQVQAETDAQLRQAWEALKPNCANIKVKVKVPPKLMEEADGLFSDFLWKSILPLENVQAEETTITVTSSVPEIIAAGLDRAGEEYDLELLKQYGVEAFS